MSVDRSGWLSREAIEHWRNAPGAGPSVEQLQPMLSAAHDIADQFDQLEREYKGLVDELDEAEAYEQKLRQVIVDAIDEFAAGHASVALSMLNEALRDYDSQADVMTSSKHE